MRNINFTKIFLNEMNYYTFFAIFACLISCELFSAGHHVDPVSPSEATAVSIDFEVLLRPYRDAEVLDDDFLRWSEVKKLDLSSLTQVIKMEIFCLSKMIGLEHIIFPPKLKEINHNVLSSCKELTSVNLSGLPFLECIDSSFLSRCTSLTSVKLSGLPFLKEIGSFFLNECTSLTSVNLSDLPRLEEIGSSFLKGCTSLTSVDLSGLRNLTELPNDFLYGCVNLKEVDFSMLKKVVRIQDCILYENTIEHLIISSGCLGIIRILRYCPRIRKITCRLDALDDGTILYPDLEGYQVINDVISPNLRYFATIKLDQLEPRERLWEGFLRDCARVGNVNLAPLENINTIMDGFLSGCRSLEELEI